MSEAPGNLPPDSIPSRRRDLLAARLSLPTSFNRLALSDLLAALTLTDGDGESRDRALSALTWMNCRPREWQSQLQQALTHRALRLGSGADASDVAQDVFTVLIEKYPGVLDPLQLTKIAMTITRNRARVYGRQPLAVDAEVAVTLDFVAALERGRKVSTLRKAIARLPARYRHFLVLELKGYETSEIADEIGISHSNVYVLRNRILRALRRLVGQGSREEETPTEPQKSGPRRQQSKGTAGADPGAGAEHERQ